MKLVAALVWSLAVRAAGSKRRKADDKHAMKDPEERKAHRLEKYDRLIEMAQKANVDMPNLRSDVEALKAREEAIMDRDAELRPPKPPRLGGSEDEDLGEGDSPYNSGIEALIGGEYRKEGEAIDPEKREEMMRASKERMERMRDMTPDERIEEMRKHRDKQIAEQVAEKKERTPEERDPLSSLMGTGGRHKKQRTTGLENLTPDERHAKLMEHQANMEEHRAKMDTWRAQHEDYITERRAIMDAYRDLSHQIRESIFANRPL